MFLFINKLNRIFVKLTRKEIFKMCIVCAKYFKDYGWVGVKNRDRNYIPQITIKQSYRNGVERMLLWDDKTKYTDGLNEHGVCILSAAVAVKKDEKEGSRNRAEDKQFYSPDGKKIRKALYEDTIDKALEKCIEFELPGNTLIFDRERCILLEGGFEAVREKSEYKYEWKEIPNIDISEIEIIQFSMFPLGIPCVFHVTLPTLLTPPKMSKTPPEKIVWILRLGESFYYPEEFITYLLAQPVSSLHPQLTLSQGQRPSRSRGISRNALWLFLFATYTYLLAWSYCAQATAQKYFISCQDTC